MSVCFVTVGLINPVIGQDNPPLGLTATPGDGVIDLMWYPPFDLNSFDLTGEWNLDMDYYFCMMVRLM